MSAIFRCAYGFLSALRRSFTATSSRCTRARRSALDVALDERREGAAGADAAAACRRRGPTGRCLRDCFSHATREHPLVDAGLDEVASRRSTVEPPTLPAVWTRSIGLPGAAERVGEEQLRLHDAFERVGRLADDDRVDVARRSCRRPRGRGRRPRGTGRASRGRRGPWRACVWPTPTTAAALLAHDSLPPGRTTRLCCRPWPPVACATARGPPSPAAIALRGFDDADQAGGHHRVAGERAARRVDLRVRRRGRAPRRRIDSCGLNVADSSTTSTGALSTPALRPASAVDDDDVRSRMPGWCGSMRWSMPADPDRRSCSARVALSPRGEDHRGRAVGDRRQVVAAQRLRARTARRAAASTSDVARHLRVRVRLGVARGCGRRPRRSRARSPCRRRSAPGPAARRSTPGRGRAARGSTGRAATGTASYGFDGDDLPEPNTSAVSMSPCCRRTHASYSAQAPSISTCDSEIGGQAPAASRFCTNTNGPPLR